MEDLVYRLESDYYLIDYLLPDSCKISSGSVYHYTDDAATKGILDKGIMWASNVAHMNDESELKYSRNLIKLEIDKRLDKADDPYDKHLLSDIKKHILSRKLYGIYVISFSRLKDNLNQWMKYTSGKELRCSLEFDVADLRSRIPFPGSLYNVIYDQDEQLQLINKIIDHLLSYFKNIQYEYGTDIINDTNLLNYSRQYMEFIIPIMKNPEFHSEAETRAILLRKELGWIFRLPVKKRRAVTREIQYIEFPLLFRASGGQEKLPIKEIIIQCNSYSIFKKNISDHCKNTNNKKIKICKSERAYRVI